MTMTYPFPVSEDEFKGKRVLVTGGTKGMGQAMVRRFTLSGASVATTARSPLPNGQAVELFIQMDIGTAAGVQRKTRHLEFEPHTRMLDSARQLGLVVPGITSLGVPRSVV